MKRIVGVAVLLVVCMQVQAWTAPEATITSDDLEIQDNGKITIFKGHVILQQAPFSLKADRMIRIRDTGVVNADGNLLGAWVSVKSERVQATGSFATYTPKAETIELWGNPKLTRWETPKDPSPVTVKADRFVAHQDSKTIRAMGHVEIEQASRLLSKSDEALLDQNNEVLELSGETPIRLSIRDSRGNADIKGDKGWVWMHPKKARLSGRVSGRVIPAEAL